MTASYVFGTLEVATRALRHAHKSDALEPGQHWTDVANFQLREYPFPARGKMSILLDNSS